ncbi:hypothetical protein HDU76_013313 [Blyttiomyces sp. JEL0837]|nr:hypothetical protein HDU76_013313 [Blyttiomyces sp. JEL0837]
MIDQSPTESPQDQPPANASTSSVDSKNEITEISSIEVNMPMVMSILDAIGANEKDSTTSASFAEGENTIEPEVKSQPSPSGAMKLLRRFSSLLGYVGLERSSTVTTLNVASTRPSVITTNVPEEVPTTIITSSSSEYTPSKSTEKIAEKHINNECSPKDCVTSSPPKITYNKYINTNTTDTVSNASTIFSSLPEGAVLLTKESGVYVFVDPRQVDENAFAWAQSHLVPFIHHREVGQHFQQYAEIPPMSGTSRPRITN